MPSSRQAPKADRANPADRDMLRAAFPTWTITISDKGFLLAQHPSPADPAELFYSLDGPDPHELAERMREHERALGLPNGARPQERA
ncbi:hypothetical protein [Actinomadura yumaensis]|uniref:Uncharacterized protein n=1 Tax=Actinomadura yumaensis TaxID=111807 RepID=A0ABW2CRY6_9ACTN